MNKYLHYDEYLKSGVDFGNTDQLVLDLWLFVTGRPVYTLATVKKEAFIHEVTALITAIREYERKVVETGIASLSVMSPEQFREFLDKKLDQERPKLKELSELAKHPTAVNNLLEAIEEVKPPVYECPKCKQQQEYRYATSGTLYCYACGELLDDIRD